MECTINYSTIESVPTSSTISSVSAFDSRFGITKRAARRLDSWLGPEVAEGPHGSMPFLSTCARILS
jgi:hypothetical protein